MGYTCLRLQLSLLGGRFSRGRAAFVRQALLTQVANVTSPGCPPLLFIRGSSQPGATQDPERVLLFPINTEPHWFSRTDHKLYIWSPFFTIYEKP